MDRRRDSAVDDGARHGGARNGPDGAQLDLSRASAHKLGLPTRLTWRGYPPWAVLMCCGFVLWLAMLTLELAGVDMPPLMRLLAALVIGLLILASACDALVTATERLAARQRWDSYVAGTVAEILSTLPELVVIAFVIPVSPLAALVIALVTIYNNALVFSVYSYFLPKNQRGRFIMPEVITEAGTQILVAGAGFGSVIGLVMLVLSSGDVGKQSFTAIDLAVLALIMLAVFAVYIHTLLKRYASEELAVQKALKLDAPGMEARRERAYEEVQRTSPGNIMFLFAIGVIAAFIGGEQVSEFANTAIRDIEIGPIATAIVLAAFAGLSEYVILFRAHRKGQYRIALANAFGGITQVMFLVLPFTLMAIAVHQGVVGAAHPELPLLFSFSTILLFLLLFPTFFVLTELIEEDHTLGALDTTIMASIFLLIILILVTYG